MKEDINVDSEENILVSFNSDEFEVLRDVLARLSLAAEQVKDVADGLSIELHLLPFEVAYLQDAYSAVQNITTN